MSLEIHIIGLGIEQPAKLSSPALSAIDQAELILGSNRQLSLVDCPLDKQAELPKLTLLAKRIKPFSKVVVLASGDPLHYGIGRWFTQNYDASRLHFHPALSSIQAICHQLQLSQQDVEVVSLHGRPVEKIRRCLKANRYFVILTDKYSQPQRIAEECFAANFQLSTIWVGENLGFDNQRIQTFDVNTLKNSPIEFNPLHITVIKTLGEGNVLPEFPGIPDINFITDGESGQGLLTKREVRLNILSLLRPSAQDIAWDIGAGCGGVAIEWAYWNPFGQVYALEQHQQRVNCLEQNQRRFGVIENLHIVSGSAPQACASLPRPNKIFIGGSGGKLHDILTLAWSSLAVDGLLVASSVTEETKQTLLQFAHSEPSLVMDSVQIAISRQGTLAGQTLYRPQLPITLFKFTRASP